MTLLDTFRKAVAPDGPPFPPRRKVSIRALSRVYGISPAALVRHQRKFGFTHSEMENVFHLANVILESPLASRGKFVRLLENPDARRAADAQILKLKYPGYAPVSE